MKDSYHWTTVDVTVDGSATSEEFYVTEYYTDD